MVRGLLCGLGLPGSLEGPLCWGRLALARLPEDQLYVNSLPWAQALWLDTHHLSALPPLPLSEGLHSANCKPHPVGGREAASPDHFVAKCPHPS